MKGEVEQRSMDFHNRARTILFSLYSEFRHAAGAVDRKRNENVFQQLQARFAGQLKQRLQNVAVEILQQADSHEQQQELSHVLSYLIEEYSKEFMQKARSL